MPREDGQWKSGQSGNPNGRPRKGNTLNEILEKDGKRLIDDEDGKRRSRLKVLSRRLWDLALSKDITAIKYVCDRLGGRPTEKVEVVGDEGGPIGVVFLPEKVTPEQWIKNGNNGGSLESAAKTGDSVKVSSG